MPIYEYKCTECSYRLEKLQKMSDDPLKECPECEKPALTKLVSASSFKLKGTGWYETDFKNKKKPESSSSDTVQSSSKSTKSEVKSEVKSGSKSESKTASKSKSDS